MIRLRPAVLSLLLSLVLLVPAAAQSSDAVFPSEGWEYVRPWQLADLGWDAQALRTVMEHLRDDSNSTGVVVVDRGRVVFRCGISVSFFLVLGIVAPRVIATNLTPKRLNDPALYKRESLKHFFKGVASE